MEIILEFLDPITNNPILHSRGSRSQKPDYQMIFAVIPLHLLPNYNNIQLKKPNSWMTHFLNSCWPKSNSFRVKYPNKVYYLKPKKTIVKSSCFYQFQNSKAPNPSQYLNPDTFTQIRPKERNLIQTPVTWEQFSFMGSMAT